MFIRNFFKKNYGWLFIFFILYPSSINANSLQSKNSTNKISSNELGYIEPSCKDNLQENSNMFDISTNKIKIVTPDSKKWVKLLLRAKTNPSKNIGDKYKKKFNSSLLLYSE